MKSEIKIFSKKTPLTICLATLLVVTTVIALLNVIAMSQIKSITSGMTYEEVIDVLGEMKPSKSSGFVKSEWGLANGDSLVIVFEESNKTGELVVAVYFVE